MKNESGLRPLGRAVLVKPYEPELRKSIIEIPQTAQERATMLETRAIVVEVGPSAWDDEKAPRAKPGDKVLLTMHAGRMAVGPADGVQYRIVNDRDIFAGLTKEANV